MAVCLECISLAIHELAFFAPKRKHQSYGSCLLTSIGDMSELCNGKVACTLICPSYNMRYKIYPFCGDVVAPSSDHLHFLGILEDGQHVDVKRLSMNLKQGIIEFKGDVLLVGKLQHRDVVKLLGFYLARKEEILICEFLLNLNAIQRAYLDWMARFKIISEITKGLLYLHEDYRLKIVHQDLKSSNVLPNDCMNPKIVDFGMIHLLMLAKLSYPTGHIWLQNILLMGTSQQNHMSIALES
ncbi:hypothetical protein Cgig2_004274 [Carnegiea gigantea]|uniref:non-specific serine/threonine protein kinase n=1 Tax=Carnegiea gigantea TaxID=171969 RepID=A0A9Q1QIH7_9CARY|nr:hypothetical protein Cgig2_004274 [Carnegiea gigantea]